MLRRVENTEVEIVRTNQRGVYSGATQAFVRTQTPRYPNSVRAVTDCEFWVIDGTDFGEKVRGLVPDGDALEGLDGRLRNSQSAIGARERLLSLGRLSAGLTHELNNPAAAAVYGRLRPCASRSAKCGASWPTWRRPRSIPRG